MNPTHRALLLLCRLEMSPAERRSAADLAATVDWDEIFRLAQQGGVAGLVSRNLEGIDLPRETRLAFATSALRVQHRNRVLMDESLELCTSAAAEGLDLIPLKGAALNLGTPYGDLGMRAMADLDLLARPAQFPALEALLTRHGYGVYGDRQQYLRHSHHLAYEKRAGPAGVYLEVHWSPYLFIYGRPAIDAVIIDRARRLDHRGHLLSVLAPHDLMLSLLLHFAVHRFRAQLKWLVDLREVAVLYQGALDWSRVWNGAREMHGLRAALFAAHLARELIGAPIPPCTDRPKDLTALRLLTDVADTIASQPQPPWARGLLINLLQLDSPWPAVRFVVHKAAELGERYSGVLGPAWLTRRGSGVS